MIRVNTREDFLKEVSKLLPAKSICIELGVLYGDFSKMILDILNPQFLALSDPFQTNDKFYTGALAGTLTAYSTFQDYENLKKRFYNERLTGQVKIFKEYSYDIVKYLPDSIYDMIYIDASHVYEDVKRDLNDWLSKLKENGLMCGHDYAFIDGFGVVEAVNEFMKDHFFEIIIYNDNGGDFALQKIK